MKLLSREQLLKKDVLEKKEVILDEKTGEGVWVRQMTAREKNNWEIAQTTQKTIATKKGKKTEFDLNLNDYRAKLAVQCVCDEDGVLIFKPEDFKVLTINWSALKMEKIADVANELNAITEEDIEEMTKK